MVSKSLSVILLLESWVASTRNTEGKLLDIYRNPSQSDVTDVLKVISPDNAVRLVVDTDEKTVYMAPSNLLHWKISEKIGIKRYSNLEGRIVKGKIVLSPMVWGYDLSGASVIANEYYSDPDKALNIVLSDYNCLTGNNVFDQDSVRKMLKRDLTNKFGPA